MGQRCSIMMMTNWRWGRFLPGSERDKISYRYQYLNPVTYYNSWLSSTMISISSCVYKPMSCSPVVVLSLMSGMISSNFSSCRDCTKHYTQRRAAGELRKDHPTHKRQNDNRTARHRFIHTRRDGNHRRRPVTPCRTPVQPPKEGAGDGTGRHRTNDKIWNPRRV